MKAEVENFSEKSKGATDRLRDQEHKVQDANIKVAQLRDEIRWRIFLNIYFLR